MSDSDPILYMVRLDLDALSVIREIDIARLPSNHDDPGYPLHCYLAGLFGAGTAQPFRMIDDRQRRLAVLAYTNCDAVKLRQHAEAFADPWRFAGCDWDRFAVKPMRNNWPRGAQIGFDLRACPVVRLSSEIQLTRRDGGHVALREGAEVDAWEHACHISKQGDPSVSREAAYASWLADRLGDAAHLNLASVKSFRRVRLGRRDHGTSRKGTIIERPDVVLAGELTVTNPAAFRDLLAKGVGRHRAFGFGMLLLRPVGSS